MATSDAGIFLTGAVAGPCCFYDTNPRKSIPTNIINESSRGAFFEFRLGPNSRATQRRASEVFRNHISLYSLDFNVWLRRALASPSCGVCAPRLMMPAAAAKVLDLAMDVMESMPAQN